MSVYSAAYLKIKANSCHTIALIELPLGPVTDTQAPHSAALSQASPEKAVPNRCEGMV